MVTAEIFGLQRLLSGAFACAFACASTASAAGEIAGRTGGNERDCVVFARGRGAVAFAITYGDGDFRFEDLEPGEYMVLSSGRVASRIPVRAGAATRLDFGEADYVSIPAETWSPARRRFGQTFVAESSQIEGISFWIPAGSHRLAIEFREEGPAGRLVASRRTSGPVGWVVAERFREGEVPTEPGRRYYVEISSLDGEPWQIGTPGRGDVYPEGEAWYDGEPMLDADLGISLESDVSGLVESAAARDGLGFVAEGPGSGLSREAGQTFVATTRNVVAAYANAGWGGKPEPKLDFEFSLREEGPGGRLVAGPTRLPMISDWGATAVWFPDEAPVVPGKRYYLSFRRADGEPFYAYLSRDECSGGCAWRDGKPLEGFDCTFSIRGEKTPGSLTYPYDVSWTASERSLRVRWKTSLPCVSEIILEPPVAGVRAIPVSRVASMEHAAEIAGLRGGVEYEAVAISRPAGPSGPGFPVRSAPFRFRTAGEPPALGSDRAAQSSQRILPEGAGPLGQAHRAQPGEEVPRKIDPPERTLHLREVPVAEGETYVLSALVFAREEGGGWQRNNRVRLLALPSEPGAREGATLERLASDPALRESRASQWYATGGEWRRVRFRFRASGPRAAVGVEFYRWWALDEDAVFADDVRLEKQLRGPIAVLRAEGESARRARRERVAERRKGTPVLVHRGASRFAPENSLEAYKAAMDRGADGFEIDIRRSADGVLYILHDDTLDRTTECSGEAKGRTYRELLACPLKGSRARIPTLVSVLELARQRAALLHLDVKEPGLEEDIARLLDAADLWEHVVEVNPGNAESIRGSPKARLLRYKGWLPEEDAGVASFLAREGEMVFTKEDPERAVRALGRGAAEPVPLPEWIETDW